jgi:hypothetical protein
MLAKNCHAGDVTDRAMRALRPSSAAAKPARTNLPLLLCLLAAPRLASGQSQGGEDQSQKAPQKLHPRTNSKSGRLVRQSRLNLPHHLIGEIAEEKPPISNASCHVPTA